jgi:hypothetical protein
MPCRAANSVCPHQIREDHRSQVVTALSIGGAHGAVTPVLSEVSDDPHLHFIHRLDDA